MDIPVIKKVVGVSFRCRFNERNRSNYANIAITHLPQIAAKGNAHFKVSKLTIGGYTIGIKTVDRRGAYH
jgi:hypothetical protein